MVPLGIWVFAWLEPWAQAWSEDTDGNEQEGETGKAAIPAPGAKAAVGHICLSLARSQGLGAQQLNKKRKGLSYNCVTTFVTNACNINCFYCGAFWNKQRSGSVCARQHENKTPNLPLAAFSLNELPNMSSRKEYTTTMTAGGCKQVVKVPKQKGVI